MLGPMCIIASLSIGATRTFRIRRVGAPDGSAVSTSDSKHISKTSSEQVQPVPEPPQRAAAQLRPSAAAQQRSSVDQKPPSSRAACLPPTTVDIELKHNTLVIMWPPMQEEWKHEASAQLMLRHACGC